MSTLVLNVPPTNDLEIAAARKARLAMTIAAFLNSLPVVVLDLARTEFPQVSCRLAKRHVESHQAPRRESS